MKQNPTPVQVTEFNLKAIQQAFAEGRLFIAPKAATCEDREDNIRQILQYVRAIDDCTSASYRSHIGELWSDILHDSTLGDLFFYTRYARNRGQINWYRVTVMVCLLREMHVYRNDLTGSELHCRLEGTKKRNGRYTGMNRYLLEGRYFSLIRKKLQFFQQ